jgi:phospholipid/cholesterol/gamma-HCH transport system substrate-binding protein
MQKQALSFWRIAAMVIFALSCFGILTFLWVSFGGSVPLKPKKYEVKVDFPEATTLAEQADVRISGVPVGTVQHKQLDGHYTQATLRIDPAYAPLPLDVKAILRQKTLLGETYVELTPGNRNGPKIAEGGRIRQRQVAQTVQLDEIFRAFDPKTRIAFRTWLEEQGRAFNQRGRDLNNALGNLTPFEEDANTLLQLLNEQRADTSRLVANTGVVFDALTERGDQLRSLIENSNRVFATTASRDARLKELFTVFPTFLDESRATAVRLTAFARNANPLITQLRPAARELSPTLIDLRALAPDLNGLFRDLGPLITVARKGLPAVRRILDDTTPLLGQLDPFLRNLNPMLDYLGIYKHEITQFFANDVGSTQAVDRPPGSNVPIHYLRTANPLNPENLAAYPVRIASNRSNPYVAPLGYRRLPLKVFGTYLCSSVPVPTLFDPNNYPPGLPPLPPNLNDLFPGDLLDRVNQFALNSGTVPAPPCTEQPPNGRLVGQTGKYAQVKAAPRR